MNEKTTAEVQLNVDDDAAIELVNKTIFSIFRLDKVSTVFP